jgi:U4/U6 small nuclear ribonucleoprotein PRP4
VLCADFHPNGYAVATGGGDNVVRVWDLRKKECAHTVPAHGKLVSSVRFDRHTGGARARAPLLLTTSYDATCKAWSSLDYSLVKTLAGHEGGVTRGEISPDAQYVATTSFDRTWKLWSAE